jgi:DNA-binding response OmpR family regulator
MFLATLLRGIPEWQWAITTAVSEDAALAEFGKGGIEVTILDYQLAQGDGLSCVRRLRKLDPIVPIVAVSAVAPPEISAELLHAGADTFIKKQDLNREILAGTLRELLGRTDRLRQRVPRTDAGQLGQLESSLRQLSAPFTGSAGAELAKRLDEFEQIARQANLTYPQCQRLFDTVTQSLEGETSSRKAVRPLLLEVLLRLYGEGSPG